MKVKYYSEVLNKYFDAEDDLVKAEKEHAEIIEAKEKEKTAVANEKKTLAAAVELAEANIDEARERYSAAKEEASKIIAEANQKAQELLKPAEEAVRKAQKEKYDSIAAFNKKFGPYMSCYTGDKAYNEFKRSSDWVNELFRAFMF